MISVFVSLSPRPISYVPETMTTYKGSCHCGMIEFEIDSNLDAIRSCDCSICRRRGALNQRVGDAQFRLLSPSAAALAAGTHGLLIYQWNTYTATDYICPPCGIMPFRRPRTAPYLWAVNVRCLDGIKLEDLKIRPVFGSCLSIVAEKPGNNEHKQVA